MRLKFFAFFGVLIIFVNSQLTFKKWQAKYNLSYSIYDRDYNKKTQAFDVSASFVAVNRLKYDFGYELGLNGFADVPFQQFQNTYSGLKLPNRSELGNKIIYATNRLFGPNNIILGTVSTPTSVDYRNYSLPVQNQKLCNSCWAFSVVEVLGMILSDFT